MRLDFTSDKPIYLQIADEIEDAVFTGAFPEETQVPSTTEISTQFRINPATVLKGMSQLVEKGILYKKRGVGMFVSTGAVAAIAQERQERFFTQFVAPMLQEAKKLGLTEAEIIRLIGKGEGYEQD